MRTAEQTGAAPAQRRVGTFTLGVTLVLGGLAMLASLFYPRMDLTWALKSSPLILVSLGTETLLSARKGGRVKYDWLGMLLCFVLIGAALCMFGAVWWLTAGRDLWPNQVHSRYAGEDRFRMEYTNYNYTNTHTMTLRAGEILRGRTANSEGWIDAEIFDGEGNTLWEARPMDGEARVDIPEDGEYTIWVTGCHASGSFLFERMPPDEAEPPEETPPDEG